MTFFFKRSYSWIFVFCLAWVAIFIFMYQGDLLEIYAANASQAEKQSSWPVIGERLDYTDARGQNFPAPASDLIMMLNKRDVPGMRRHMWNVWAYMTDMASSGFPNFLTWYQVSEVFGWNTASVERRFAPEFRIPSQKTLGDGDAILSFNLFNRSYRSHILKHGYQVKKKLLALVGHATDIVDFPNDAISVKTVWWPVRNDGLTAFPVWDGKPTRPIIWGRGDTALVDSGFFKLCSPQAKAQLKMREEEGNDFESFARIVAIDPKRNQVPDGEMAKVEFFDPYDPRMMRQIMRTGRVVPLEHFFTVQINDQKTVDWINSLPLSDKLTLRFWKRKFQIGDYVALVAVHISTREIPDWAWATFFWHDKPDEGPYGNDRPPEVPPVFRNYRMMSVFHAELPLGQNKMPAVAFNPYLEAAFAYGPLSNCAACHQRAVMTAEGPGDPFPVRLGYLPKDDPFYKGKLRLDTSWSLAIEAK